MTFKQVLIENEVKDYSSLEMPIFNFDRVGEHPMAFGLATDSVVRFYRLTGR